MGVLSQFGGPLKAKARGVKDYLASKVFGNSNGWGASSI